MTNDRDALIASAAEGFKSYAEWFAARADNLDGEPLIVRGVYELRARNLNYGVWTGSTWCGIRQKFDDQFLDECEVPGRTAAAIRFVGMVPDEIESVVSSLGSVCGTCGHWVDFDRERGETAAERWYHIHGPSDHDVRPWGKTNRPLFDYLATVDPEFVRIEHQEDSDD